MKILKVLGKIVYLLIIVAITVFLVVVAAAEYVSLPEQWAELTSISDRIWLIVDAISFTLCVFVMLFVFGEAVYQFSK